MPKKKAEESAEEQVRRFEEAVAQMIADGELDPTEADATFEKLLAKAAPVRRK